MQARRSRLQAECAFRQPRSAQMALCGRVETTTKMVRRPARFAPDAPSACQPACKPGSVRGRRILFVRVTTIPLHRRLPGVSSNLPGWLVRTNLEIALRAIPIRFCSRWGLPCRSRCRDRGALLPHRFTLACRRSGRRSASLWHCPWGRPRRTLSGTVRPWSPDFPPRHPFGERPRGLCRSGRPAD